MSNEDLIEEMSNEDLTKRIHELENDYVERTKIGNVYYQLLEERLNRHICAECGNIYEVDNNYENPDGFIVCEECYLENYYCCDDCGDVIRQEDTIVVHDDSRICEYCMERHYVECTHCNQLFNTDRMREVEGDPICEDCINDGRVEVYCCDACDEMFYSDNIIWNDNGNGYCRDCHSDAADASCCVLDYHGFENWQPRGTDELKYGFELEIENNGCDIYQNDVVKTIYNIMNADIVCEHDGSLNNGFEIISHPMDMTYIKANEHKIKEMLTYLKKIGYVSHNPGTCGLHVHASRLGLGSTKAEQNRVINNLLMLFENFMEELIVFSRRRESQIERWSQFLSKYLGCNSDIIGMKFIDKNKDNTGRYMAINLTKFRTIEFRLFRGTLNFNSFMATIKLVDNFIKIAKKKSINGVTWNDLLGKDNQLKEYSDSRGIISTKKANEIIIKTEWTDKLDTNVNIPNEEEE